MSMSEFKRQENEEGGKFVSPAIQRSCPPDDFSEEDLAFAAELHALFSPEEENLPPYYVQTLLDVDDPSFEPAERGFEQRTSARVFRRLKLRRHLFHSSRTSTFPVGVGFGDMSLRRSLVTLVTAFLLVMVLTVAFTGESFATGVAILLHGTHGSGVSPVNQYPVNIQQPQSGGQGTSELTTISFQAAQNQLHFRMYWPQYILAPYSLSHINLYVDLDQQWADGPMLEFEYALPPSAIAPEGTGEVVVREFKPRDDVLQLVKSGASLSIGVDNQGRAMAIYVNGEWSSRGKNLPQWIYGDRSELIYQTGGVIFWIVGNQHDGVGEKQLMQIAQQLEPLSPSDLSRFVRTSLAVTQIVDGDGVQGPFSTDVIQVFPSNGNGQPYDIRVSSYQPPKDGSSSP